MLLDSFLEAAAVVTASGSGVGTYVLCTGAHLCTEKIDYKTGTLFRYSESIGAFSVGIGFFSIRSAEKSRFGLIETTQSITIACPLKYHGHARLL